MSGIAFVINQMGGMGCGGADRVVATLANFLCSKGYVIRILALTDNNQIDRALEKGVEVRFLSKIARPSNNVYNYTRLLESIKLIRKDMMEHRDTIYISFIYWVNMCTLIARGKSGNPVIISERTDPRNEPHSTIARTLRNSIYRYADKIVFQTRDSMSYFSKKVQRKGSIIRNPLPSNLPQRNSEVRKKEIVCINRLEKQKNIPLLLNAFEKFHMHHDDYVLKIYGQGKLQEEIQMLINEKKLYDHVKLMGFVSNVHEEIKNSAMYVLSSDFEGMSNSMLEAMAIGLPVISTDCPAGAAKELITPYFNGLLVPTRDVEALYKALLFITENPGKAEEMARNAKDISLQLSTGRIIGQWLKVVQEA